MVCVGAVQLCSPCKAPEANSLRTVSYCIQKSNPTCKPLTFCLRSRHAWSQRGPGMKLVGLDSAPAPIGSTSAFGAQDTNKPFHLTHTMIRLLLEPKHMQTGGSSLTWQRMGLGAKHKVVRPCYQQRGLLQNHWFLQGAEKHVNNTSGKIFVMLPHGLIQVY